MGLTQVLVADDGSSEVYNLFGLDLISQDDGSQTRTLLADGLGSTRLEMVDGVVETTSSYEPFGKLLMQAGDSGTVYGYTGERYDSATNLVFLRARYYSPDLKVFMSRDPFPGVMTMPASQHGYSYAHNNPVNLTDPSGEVVLPIVIPIAFALILLALGIVAFANPPSAPVKLPDIDIDVDWQRLFRPEILAIVACSMLPKLLTELKQQWDEDGRPIPWSPDNNESNGKDIALGWDPYLHDFTDWLNELYNPQSRNVYNYRTWVPHVTKIPTWSGAQFRDAAQNAGFIHFELTGVDEFLLPRAGLTYEQLMPLYGNMNEPPRGKVTLWELAQIKSQNLCHKTIFYRLPSLSATDWESAVSAPQAICP